MLLIRPAFSLHSPFVSRNMLARLEPILSRHHLVCKFLMLVVLVLTHLSWCTRERRVGFGEGVRSDATQPFSTSAPFFNGGWLLP